MQLTGDDIREFGQLWQDEFHETLSEEQIKAAASALFDLSLLLANPELEDGQSSSHKI